MIRKAMDPQQRLLLETTYEAFENGRIYLSSPKMAANCSVAGIALNAIRGTQTGVYVGAVEGDYTDLLFKDVEDVPVYQSTGNSASMLSNRISYVFDLKGASITMDTACSSSLAALHTACQSLRAGDHTQVVVCGAHIMLNPDTMIGMSMLRYELYLPQLRSRPLKHEDYLARKASHTCTITGAPGTVAEKELSA